MLWQAGLAVLALVLIWKYFADDHPLDRLPGPPKFPFVGNALYLLGVNLDDLFSLMITFPKLYGYRYVIKVFNRRILHVYNVEDVEAILSHTKNITKNKPYMFLEPWLGTGLLLSTGKKWHSRRKILTPTFHFNVLKNFSKTFEEKSRDLVERLKGIPKDDFVDVLAVISDYTLYTICETAMGTKLDSDKSKASVEYKESIKKIGDYTIRRLTKFWLHPDIVFNRTALGKQFNTYLDIVRTFADNVIAKRKEKVYDFVDNLVQSDDKNKDNEKKRQALLDLLIESEIKGEIDVEGIREEVNTFMFEGHDTTAMALTFGLLLLADHEDVQEKIYNECQHIFGESDRTPSWTDLADMKYVEAAVKEILRLYPSVPFIGREVTEDFMLDDLPVRKGTEILVHIYDLHRREDIYPDPEAFKPERFLSAVSRHPYAFVPFSAGPRNCIGQKFAMLEMKCALSEICRHFKLFPKTKGARPKLKADIVLRPIDSIYVKFITR